MGFKTRATMLYLHSTGQPTAGYSCLMLKASDPLSRSLPDEHQSTATRTPEQPDKRIYHQLDMNLEFDPDRFKRRQAKNLLPLTNYRAPVGGKDEGNRAHEVIRHGQILEIENMGGDEDKLPSFDILNITYALMRIFQLTWKDNFSDKDDSFYDLRNVFATMMLAAPSRFFLRSSANRARNLSIASHRSNDVLAHRIYSPSLP